jgi:uridine phosphorylase
MLTPAMINQIPRVPTAAREFVSAVVALPSTVLEMEGARYPNFANKHEHEAIFSPGEVVARLNGDGHLTVPDAVILTYQPSLLHELEARGVQPTRGYPGPWRSLWFTGSGTRKIAVVGGFGIGAPAAVTVLEELIALGTREFISIGSAGCLQPRCSFGEAIVCAGAIRDEGVSHHYAPTEKFAWPSEGLTARLAAALAAGGTAPEAGLTWTIDAPYRETVAEARSYQAEGVLCVEMEAAALFAVGRYRRVEVAAAFVVSDHLLAADRWTHAFGTQTLRDGSTRLLDAALQTLDGNELPR